MEQQSWEAFGYGILTLWYLIEKLIAVIPAYFWGALSVAIVLGAIHSRLAR